MLASFNEIAGRGSAGFENSVDAVSLTPFDLCSFCGIDIKKKTTRANEIIAIARMILVYFISFHFSFLRLARFFPTDWVIFIRSSSIKIEIGYVETEAGV
ncbi:hypothetical protein CKA38_13360 [Ereboglobus luteus]|uniref:Uncharacterized protein n=1 Tax=Ereboglobus luteus TaxID=1796921 RepID=A0A2U8E6F5_9BACT|nr:hypothetical protein CKA38_13360 [Ereboglobus luteus]